MEIQLLEMKSSKGPVDYSKAKGLSLQMLEETRQLVERLRTPLADGVTPVKALRRQLQTLEQACPKLQIHADISPLLDKVGEDVTLSVYRVVCEALHNVQRHARADHLEVHLRVTDQWVYGEITDDGAGFDLPHVKETTTRYGLRAMSERIALQGGDLQVHTAPGEGTKVVFSVPDPQYLRGVP